MRVAVEHVVAEYERIYAVAMKLFGERRCAEKGDVELGRRQQLLVDHLQRAMCFGCDRFLQPIDDLGSVLAELGQRSDPVLSSPRDLNDDLTEADEGSREVWRTAGSGLAVVHDLVAHLRTCRLRGTQLVWQIGHAGGGRRRRLVDRVVNKKAFSGADMDELLRHSEAHGSRRGLGVERPDLEGRWTLPPVAVAKHRPDVRNGGTRCDDVGQLSVGA